MPATYTRQSSFSNGDVIDAPLFNAEYDQLVAAFVAATGHNHDGTEGAGAAIPFISDGATQKTGIFTDVTDANNKKIRLFIDGVEIATWSEASGATFISSTNVTHTPDGDSAHPLNTYLDSLEVAVGDAAADAAAAALSAQQAENAAMVVGVPVILADGENYTINDDAQLADIVCEGDSTITLPTTFVEGRRFFIRLDKKAASSKEVRIPVATGKSIIGDIGTVSAGDTLVLQPNDLIILEVVSATEVEIL